MIHEKTVSRAIEREKLLEIQQCHGSDCQGHGDVRFSDLYKIHMVGVKRCSLSSAARHFVPNNIKWGLSTADLISLSTDTISPTDYILI